MQAANTTYISREGKTLGRFSLVQLRALLASGVVRRDDLAFADRNGDWLPVEEFLELATANLPEPVQAGHHDSAGVNGYANGYAAAGLNGKNVAFQPEQAEMAEPVAPPEELAEEGQRAFLRGRCRWVDPEITKAEAQKLIERLQEETMAGAVTDEQMRQLLFFHLEYPRGASNRAAAAIISKYIGEHPGCDREYREWRRTFVDDEY